MLGPVRHPREHLSGAWGCVLGLAVVAQPLRGREAVATEQEAWPLQPAASPASWRFLCNALLS